LVEVDFWQVIGCDGDLNDAHSYSEHQKMLEPASTCNKHVINFQNLDTIRRKYADICVYVSNTLLKHVRDESSGSGRTVA
jgi:hypothetical protein